VRQLVRQLVRLKLALAGDSEAVSQLEGLQCQKIVHG
jgi:hypothetical protein